MDLIILTTVYSSFINNRLVVSSLTYRRGGYCCNACPTVRIFLRGHPLKLSESLHSVVTLHRLKVTFSDFWEKISLRLQRLKKDPKWPKMTFLGQ